MMKHTTQHQPWSKLFPIPVFFAAIITLVGCTAITPQLSDTSSPEQGTPLDSSSQASSSEDASSEVILEPESEPINVRIDYIGVENAYGGNVQLAVVVSDGDMIESYSIPGEDNYYHMDNFGLESVNRRVFHTADLKGNLKLNIVAYHRDQLKETNLKLIDMMEWYYGDSINMLKDLVLNMPENDKLIGEYERTWYIDESIDTGAYHETAGNLHIWFSVWSDSEPAVIPNPPFRPNVMIVDVKLPSGVKARSPLEYILVDTYSTTLTLQNNEGVDIMVNITIEGQGNCLDIIAFTGGDVTIPGYGVKEITTRYYYETAGTKQIAYAIYYKGVKLDSWTGTLSVTP